MQNKRIVFFGLFVLGLFTLHGIVSPGTKVSVAYSFSDFDEEDIASFFTAYLDNVTATIATGSSSFRSKLAGSSAVITLDHVAVTAGTCAYSRSAFAAISGRNSLHKISSLQLYTAAKLAPRFKFSSSSSLLSITTALNDTAESAGENIVDTQKYCINDILPTATADNLQTNISDYSYWPSSEPVYQAYAAELAKNSSDGDFSAESLSTDVRYSTHASIIEDVEYSILAILRSNIAANYSTATNIIDPSDVAILDYDFNTSDSKAGIMEVYVSQDFSNAVKEALSSSTKTIKGKILGFTVFTRVVPAAAFWPLDQVVGFAQTCVKTVENAGKSLIGGTQKVIKDIGQAIAGAPKTAINYVGGLCTAAASEVGNVYKTLAGKAGETLSTFANKTGFGANLKEGLGNAGKLITENASSFIGSVGRSLTSFIPVLIVGGIVLLIGFIFYAKVMTPRLGSPKGDNTRFNREKSGFLPRNRGKR